MMKLVVLSCLVAACAGSSLITSFAPIAYATPYLAPNNYRGPLSLTPGQPANILGSDGRPLDTLEVNLDRSAHYTAKALSSGELHLLKKRSVVTPFAYAAAPLFTPYAYATPYGASANYRGPLSLAPGQPANILGADGRPLDTLDVNLDRSAHYTAKALKAAGIHVLKKRSAVLAAPLSHVVVPAPVAPLAYSHYAAPTIAVVAPVARFPTFAHIY